MRTVLRALALRQLADGKSIREVAKSVGLTPKTVWLTVQRYRQGGLEGTLYERPGPSPLLEESQRQRIVALACGPPPEGGAHWSVRLLTEEVGANGCPGLPGRREDFCHAGARKARLREFDGDAGATGRHSWRNCPRYFCPLMVDGERMEGRTSYWGERAKMCWKGRCGRRGGCEWRRTRNPGSRAVRRQRGCPHQKRTARSDDA